VVNHAGAKQPRTGSQQAHYSENRSLTQIDSTIFNGVNAEHRMLQPAFASVRPALAVNGTGMTQPSTVEHRPLLTALYTPASSEPFVTALPPSVPSAPPPMQTPPVPLSPQGGAGVPVAGMPPALATAQPPTVALPKPWWQKALLRVSDILLFPVRIVGRAVFSLFGRVCRFVFGRPLWTKDA
jgi:hypothetical protein